MGIDVIPDIGTHLIDTSGAGATIGYETEYSLDDVRKLADVVRGERCLSSAIASGSLPTIGMVVPRAASRRCWGY